MLLYFTPTPPGINSAGAKTYQFPEPRKSVCRAFTFILKTHPLITPAVMKNSGISDFKMGNVKGSNLTVGHNNSVTNSPVPSPPPPVPSPGPQLPPPTPPAVMENSGIGKFETGDVEGSNVTVGHNNKVTNSQAASPARPVTSPTPTPPVPSPIPNPSNTVSSNHLDEGTSDSSNTDSSRHHLEEGTSDHSNTDSDDHHHMEEGTSGPQPMDIDTSDLPDDASSAASNQP